MNVDNQKEEGVKRLQHSVELDPSQASVHVELGEALSGLGRKEEALQAFDQALALEPDNDWSLQLKGCVLYDMGRREEAIEVMDQALALDPDLILALYCKGFALSELGRKEEAIKALQRVVGIDRGTKEIYICQRLFEDLRSLSRYEEAIQELDSILALDPENTETSEAKEEILAKLSLRKHISSDAGAEVKQGLFGTMDFDKYQESLRQKPDPSLLLKTRSEGSVIRIFCFLCGDYGETSDEGLDFFSERDGFEKPDDPQEYYLEVEGCSCHLGTTKSTIKKIPLENH